MFSQKTVCIVGAGASKELGLPMGDELKAKIGNAVGFTFPDHYTPKGGDQAVYWAARHYTENLGHRGTNPWWYAGRAIKAANAPSHLYRQFPHTHSDDEQIVLMGNLGIAVSILNAERHSAIYGDHQRETLNFESLYPLA